MVFCGSFLLWDPWPRKHHLVWMRTLCFFVFPKSIEEADHEVFHFVLTIMNEQGRLAIFHTNWRPKGLRKLLGGVGALKGLVERSKRSLLATKRGSHRTQKSTFREGWPKKMVFVVDMGCHHHFDGLFFWKRWGVFFWWYLVGKIWPFIGSVRTPMINIGGPTTLSKCVFLPCEGSHPAGSHRDPMNLFDKAKLMTWTKDLHDLGFLGLKGSPSLARCIGIPSDDAPGRQDHKWTKIKII